MTTLDNIVEEIKKAESIVVLTHETPDGDAIGSSLAMYNALKQIGKNVDVIIPECPRHFDFLAGAKDVKKEGKTDNYDLAIALDCATIDRLNGWKNYLDEANVTINIDHHTKNGMFADYNYVNPAAPACAQILIVLEALNIKITKDIGSCLLAGIITDTGGFKNQGVSAETFQFVAWLLQTGVNVSEVYKHAYQVRTRSSFELSKKAMDRLEFLEDGKIAFTYITKQDELEVNAEPGDHEGIVEKGRDIEGVEVSVFIRQRENENTYKISMRSTGNINVSDICYLFGGGGHPKAAGALIQGTIEQVKEQVLKEIRKVL